MNQNDELLFAEEGPDPRTRGGQPRPDHPLGKWKIMIVDNEDEVHTVTRLALKRLVFEEKPVSLISAYTAAEAIRQLADHPDTAVILLDVVMEEEDTGLKLAHYIRQELGNRLVRIILRTGYPGQAPEHSVIMDYDINDYKEKAELTAQKLFTSVVSALRSFRDLSVLEKNRMGLQKIIECSPAIFELQTRSSFASGILRQLAAILGEQPLAGNREVSGFVITKSNLGDFDVLAATGSYRTLTTGNFQTSVPPRLWQVLLAAYREKHSLFFPESFMIYSRGKQGLETMIFMENVKIPGKWERSILELFNLNISIALDNIYLTQEVEDTQKEIIFTLGEIAEARSRETGFHVKRVAELSRLLALRYGLLPDEAELLSLAAPTHDLGKLAIGDHILKKPGPLTAEEFAVMKTHAEIGFEILKKSERILLKSAAIIALEHHEHWDGRGYPQGLKGEEIHIFGRIVGLTDVFDALGNERVYKRAWPLERIIVYIREQRGKQFDPMLVDIFLENLDEILKIRQAFPDRQT